MDTSKVFTEMEYLEWVKKYHPVIQQANLLQRVGEAYQLKARGGFDPKYFGDIERKSFDGKTYFTIGDTGLKIPSWMGTPIQSRLYLDKPAYFLIQKIICPQQDRPMLA